MVRPWIRESISGDGNEVAPDNTAFLWAQSCQSMGERLSFSSIWFVWEKCLKRKSQASEEPLVDWNFDCKNEDGYL